MAERRFDQALGGGMGAGFVVEEDDDREPCLAAVEAMGAEAAQRAAVADEGQARDGMMGKAIAIEGGGAVGKGGRD